jgi:hypothetical protein
MHRVFVVYRSSKTRDALNENVPRFVVSTRLRHHKKGKELKFCIRVLSYRPNDGQ